MQISLFDLSQFTSVIEDNQICCVECDQNIDRDQDVIEIDDQSYCYDCVTDCSYCDSAVLEVETVYTQEYAREPELYCSDCVRRETFVCDDCDNHYTDNLSQYEIADTNEVICSGCYEYFDYFHCPDCEEYYSDRSANYTEDYIYCDNCIGDHVKSECIKAYNYDPLDDLDFLGDPKDGLYFGLELEVYVNRDLNDTAQTVSDLLENYAILKEDGSISRPGFEIVTAPCSLAIHKEKISEFFSNSNDINSNSSDLGLHIHVSRSPISQLTIGKILVFVNNPDNLDKIEDLAGRSSNHYAKLSPKKITDVKKQNSRYEAVNLLNNDTIEFRLFKSTIDPKLILARLEFVHGLVTWVKDQSMLCLDWESFTQYCEYNRALYPNLVEWLNNN